MKRAVVAALLGALLTACAAPAPPSPDAAFVGGSRDGSITVAVAVHDGRATGLTTDAMGTAVWFTGTAEAGLLDLHAVDGSQLRGGVHGRVVHGGVIPADGDDTAFTAVWADEPAGLYRADAVDGDDRIAWIRFPDGTSRGVAEIAGATVPAPDPAADLVVDGVRFGPLVRVVGGA